MGDAGELGGTWGSLGDPGVPGLVDRPPGSRNGSRGKTGGERRATQSTAKGVGFLKFARGSYFCLAIAAFAGGCQFVPFVPLEDDYARRVSESRLRQIDQAGLERFRKAQAAATVPAADPTKASEQQADAARSRFAGLAKVDLSLEQCRADALINNLDLQVALIDPTIAAETVSQEEAKFNSAFTLQAGYQSLDEPTASTLVSAEAKNLQVTPGVRIPTRTGGTVTVDLPFTRNENNNQFSTLNPSYTSDLEFSISQPLLRGAGRRTSTAALRIAGYDQQAAASRTKLEVIRQLAAVDRSYWRLYQAKRELEVRQQQYELAVEQLGRAQRRNNAGAVAEIEVIRAQAGVSDSLQAIITSQNNVLLQQRELKRIVNQPGLEVDTASMIDPTTQPDPVEFEFDSQTLLAEALHNRMELLELELQLASDAVRIGLARNGTLPLFSLDYTYRINGLGDSFEDTFHNLKRNRFEDWTVGLSAEIPLDNEEAESRVRSAILTRLQRLASRASRELSIRQEVLNAVDTLTADWQRILAARQSVILNTRALQAEQRQFDVGSSTSTDVLDAAARLADAQSTEVAALTDYQIAQVDLAFATGTLLGASKVDWTPAATPSLDTPDPKEELPKELQPQPEPQPEGMGAGSSP